MAADSPRSPLPAHLRRRLRDASGVAELSDRVGRLEERLDQLETALHESREETWDRSRVRWRGARPDANLTWGAAVSGSAFVAKAAEYGALGPGRRVVEVGPGYGRLLAAAIEDGAGFASWTGIDLSPENVSHLGARFERPDAAFVCADAEEVELGHPFDAIVSSLTFKHLYPSFEHALRNLAVQMEAPGTVVFDLIEGRRRYFERDGVTYIRWYERDEVEAILGRCGLELAAFDEVRHLETLTRLLVVARKPGS
jgi:SAM-dependent methyltransferase